MQFTVIDFNFAIDKNWIYMLNDAKGDTFYILNAESYKKLDLKTPITKKHLDYYDKGSVIVGAAKEFGGNKIIISILE